MKRRGNMLDFQVCKELKVLALEMINNAGSGHSGSVLSCGDAIYTLYTRHILTDGTKNINRDILIHLLYIELRLEYIYVYPPN